MIRLPGSIFPIDPEGDLQEEEAETPVRPSGPPTGWHLGTRFTRGGSVEINAGGCGCPYCQ